MGCKEWNRRHECPYDVYFRQIQIDGITKDTPRNGDMEELAIKPEPAKLGLIDVTTISLR